VKSLNSPKARTCYFRTDEPIFHSARMKFSSGNAKCDAEMRTASIKSVERARLSRSNDRSCCCDLNSNVTRAFFVERLIIYLQTLRRLGHGFIGSRAWRLHVQFQFARARIHASISRSVPKFTRTRTFSRNRIRECARARAGAHKSLGEE